MKLIVQTKFDVYDNEIESSDHKNKNHWAANFFCLYWSFEPCSQSRNRSDFPFWNKIPKLKFAKNECIILQKLDILDSRHFGTKTNRHEDLSENVKELRNIFRYQDKMAPHNVKMLPCLFSTYIFQIWSIIAYLNSFFVAFKQSILKLDCTQYGLHVMAKQLNC